MTGADPGQIFREKAAELLADLETVLLQLEQDPTAHSRSTIEDVFIFVIDETELTIEPVPVSVPIPVMACRTIAGYEIMAMVRRGQVTPARGSLPRKRFLT